MGRISNKIQVVGLGDCGVNIASEFEKYSQYSVYKIGANVRKGKKNYKLPRYNKAEQYEENVPRLKTFLRLVKGKLIFIVGGSGMSSNATLAILEQVKHCNITILYIKPDVDLLNDIRFKLERLVYNVLQEYTRSGIFEQMIIVHNPLLEPIIGDIPIKEYYKKINYLICWTVHTINTFDHVESISDNFSPSSEIDRICTYSLIDFNSGVESKFFNIEHINEYKYYFAIRKEEIEKNKDLFKKIKDQVKERKPLKGSISYGIFDVDQEENLIFCVMKSSKIQK
jgi:hypothetical protein